MHLHLGLMFFFSMICFTDTTWDKIRDKIRAAGITKMKNLFFSFLKKIGRRIRKTNNQFSVAEVTIVD